MPPDHSTPTPPPPTLKKDWRFKCGLAALILAMVMPLLALAVPFLGLSTATTTVLAGALVAGGPEVLCVLAVALLGKENFQHFVALGKKVAGDVILRVPASKFRYYFGLVVSLLSCLPLYLYGYAPGCLPEGRIRIYILAGADLVFIASMFIMGGEFWGKLRRIFVWEGKV
jgi:uncharacterized membrane protein